MEQGGAVGVAELVEVGEPGAELVVGLAERPPGGVVDKGHDIGTCQFRVAQSPRACTLIVQHLAGMARKNELLDNNEWAPTVRAIEDLFAAITGPPPRRYR